MKSKLTFERKYLSKHPKICSEDRTYIDFVINNTSLAVLLGDVGRNIGKFGWKTKVEFELEELVDLKNAYKSRLENGLFSAYVCAECGDEGCGAILFEIEKKEEVIEWKNFVWSDGYDDDEEVNERIKIEPIIFERAEYEFAMSELEKMIAEK